MPDTTSATIEIIGPRDIGVCTPTAPAPTKKLYTLLDRLFDHFNLTLFKPLLGVWLPESLITLQRKRGAAAYYCPAKFGPLYDDTAKLAEIALNPEHFHAQSMRETCSNLVHEMCHHHQHEFGKPGRGDYHNQEWADTMKCVGLQPTDTGAIGGRETGEHMYHIIVEGGPFALAFDEFNRSGAVIEWGDAPRQDRPSPKAKRVKVICLRCGMGFPLVPSLIGKVLCGPCTGVGVALVAA